MEWLYGLLGSGLIAGAAFAKGSLSGSGAFAAVVLGTLLYALGSPVWFGLMIGFFVSSTLWTRFKKHRKRESEAIYEKTGRRDAGQVWANGGLGTILCVVQAFLPEASWPLWAYMGVMATVTADTWATELGGLSRGRPRSITTWQPVPKGTSGGVSPLGLAAAAAGALFIGLLALLLLKTNELASYEQYALPLLVMVAGWLGANTDSVLGATIQSLYRCESCGREVEAKVHCGRTTQPYRGLRGFGNDAVNMVSSVCGGVIAVILALAA